MPEKRGASSNQLRFLEHYFTQERIADLLGISPRYQRLIKEGKRSGAKYADAVHALYDQIRKASEPPRKRRRPPRRKPVVSFVYVPDMMNVLFNVFEPRTFKPPRNPYQHRQSFFFTKLPSWPNGETFNTWDSFFIVFGVAAEGDPKFRKYRRVLVEDEMDEDEWEELQDVEADSIEMFLYSLSTLSPRERDLISHLEIREAVEDMREQVPEGLPVFVNFWISRVSTPSLTPDRAYSSMLGIAQDSVDRANEESDDVNYFLVRVYGFSGWNV